jgi:small-conductance mechanosensitive channel
VDIDWWQAARTDLRRAALYGVLAIVGLVVASQDDSDRPVWKRSFEGNELDLVLVLAATALLLVAGILAVRSLARGVRLASSQRVGDARGAALHLIVTIAGYAIVLLSVLGAIVGDLSGLLVGGALTGVIIGIAAQQTLGNFFAGLVLMIVRPFTVGEQVVLRSAPLGGLYEGRVTDMGLFYVDIVTERGPAKLPNAGVLAAAVGPGVRDPEEDVEEEEQAPASEGGPPGG